MLKLQRVQNKALKFITNTRWQEFRTTHSLHQQMNIKPINIVIYQQAKETWQNFEANLPHIYRQLQDNHPPVTINIRFPSSRLKAEQPQPLPIYRWGLDMTTDKGWAHSWLHRGWSLVREEPSPGGWAARLPPDLAGCTSQLSVCLCWVGGRGLLLIVNHNRQLQKYSQHSRDKWQHWTNMTTTLFWEKIKIIIKKWKNV